LQVYFLELNRLIVDPLYPYEWADLRSDFGEVFAG
jgi:hypothetical protein